MSQDRIIFHGNEISGEVNIALDALQGAFAAMKKRAARTAETHPERLPMVLTCQLAALAAMSDFMTASMQAEASSVMLARIKAQTLLGLLDRLDGGGTPPEASVVHKLELIKPS